jgi:hypothetical protein
MLRELIKEQSNKINQNDRNKKELTDKIYVKKNLYIYIYIIQFIHYIKIQKKDQTIKEYNQRNF